jgi:TM2 domain-containing membrane protein YozV
MAEPVCPYCRMPFDETAPPRIFCTACGTPHHEDCYRENGGCTVFGCSRAPADDPKLQVSQSDLRAVNVPVQPYGPAVPSYIPAQRATTQQYPPSIYSGPLGLSQAAAAAPAPANDLAAHPPASNTQSPPAPPSISPYPYSQPPAAGYQYVPPAIAYGRSQKSRSTYIVLGIFLGALGIHNFYGGYTGRAVGQLCLTVLTLGYLGIISWIWAIIEICIVDKDNTGLNFN